MTYKQKMEEKVRKLERQVWENAALRKQNITLTESLKEAQEKLMEMQNGVV